MRRHLLGIIGLAFLIAYALLLGYGPSDSQTRTFASICMRTGCVLVALWLAFPQLVDLLTRFPPWLLASLAVALIVLVARPKLLVVVGPLLVAVAFIQFIGWLFKPMPRQKHARKKPPDPPSK